MVVREIQQDKVEEEHQEVALMWVRELGIHVQYKHRKELRSSLVSEVHVTLIVLGTWISMWW